MKFELPKIPVNLHLGMRDEEREMKQEILLTVQWMCDTIAAEKSDDVGDTVDYFLVRECVQQFGVTGEWRLVEKFIADLRRELQQKFPRMEDVQLTVRKFPDHRWEVVVSG